MRILIYKRTHTGDPDASGLFGANGCMGRVRGFEYDAVIGIGGMSTSARACAIHGRINWIGIGPEKDWGAAAMRIDPRGPQVRFKKFVLLEATGPFLHVAAPMIARRLFEKWARYLLGSLSVEEQREAEAILCLIDQVRLPSSLKAEAGEGHQGADCSRKKDHCIQEEISHYAKPRVLVCPPRRRC
jgi:hypothetical protein